MCPRTGRSMWVIGRGVRSMGQVGISLRMGTFMMESSRRIRHTELGLITMRMGTSILENGYVQYSSTSIHLILILHVTGLDHVRMSMYGDDDDDDDDDDDNDYDGLG